MLIYHSVNCFNWTTHFGTFLNWANQVYKWNTGIFLLFHYKIFETTKNSHFPVYKSDLSNAYKFIQEPRILFKVIPMRIGLNLRRIQADQNKLSIEKYAYYFYF